MSTVIIERKIGNIHVVFENKVVRITNDKALDDMMRKNKREVYVLVKDIHHMYQELMQTELKISRKSLTAEIFGHYRAGKIAEYMHEHYPHIMKRIVNRVIMSCEVIDCGELSCDNNRWVWNIMQIFY